MRAPSHAYRGFTLIELLASITIVAIIAAVTFPNVIAANPFAERGYADAVAANLRRARDVAIATGCDVRFSIDNTGYNAMQRAAAGTHCAAAGAWARTLFTALQPRDAVLGAAQQVVFNGTDGRAGVAATIDIGARQVSVEPSGLVSGP
jgi:MSHA pilin protein MshC